MKVFVPYNELLFERLGLNMGDLVPFRLEYKCLRQEDQNDLSEVSSIVEQSPSLTVDLHS